MAPVIYTGALMPKKKQELQEIANALKISELGTKEELHGRIKKHLDNNPELEENQRFSGLFTTRGRRRSVQPQPQPAPQPMIPSSRLAPASPETNKPPSKLSRGFGDLDAVAEDTVTPDVNEVMMFLKHPMSPDEEIPNELGRQISNVASSAIEAAPATEAKSLVQQTTEHISAHIGALSTRIQNAEATENLNEFVVNLREFLSNSLSLWTLTSLFELVYILQTVIPWKTKEIALTSSGEAGYTLSLRYPPQSVFETSAFWMTLVHWALPSVIIPLLCGYFITFKPQDARRSTGPSASPRLSSYRDPSASMSIDTLTAGIIRLAAQIGYPYSSINYTISGVDVIGQQWRVLNSAVLLALAFSEAINTQPQNFARSITQNRYNRLLEMTPAPESPSIRRRAIMPVHAPAPGSPEVD